MVKALLFFHRVHRGHGNPGMAWNYLGTKSRLGKSWEIRKNKKKSWKRDRNSYPVGDIFLSRSSGACFNKHDGLSDRASDDPAMDK